MESTEQEPTRSLRKRLRLIDVYAISTGAMFSSGFFLLPGLASGEAGPAVPLAYLIAGILVIPAMLSTAELSSAIPEAGGSYRFLDRSLGPLAGTVAGIGNWATMIAKIAFSLVGMGAYISLFIDLPIRTVAIALTVILVIVNTLGTKHSSRVQIGLVAVLLLVLGYFLVAGLLEVVTIGIGEVADEQFSPFMPLGIDGLVTATATVFVSYAGVAKVASVAGEIQHPSRNIPRGMVLALITAVSVYVIGVAIMVAVLPASELRDDVAPVATAAEQFVPLPLGLVFIVAAALAAFASTGNAGMLSASRFPLAMARDRLIWERFGRLGRFRTPTASIVTTGLVTILLILLLDVESIAKVASSFLLLIFGLLNLAVIVLRRSQRKSYAPSYRSPLYPWMQFAGILISTALIIEMGFLPLLFTSVLTILSIGWYFVYAREQVERHGAIRDVYRRLLRR